MLNQLISIELLQFFSTPFYIRIDKIDNAFGIYKDLVSILEKTGDKKKQASALNNLGNIYRLREEYAKAVENLEASRRMFQELGDNQNRDFVHKMIEDIEAKMK